MQDVAGSSRPSAGTVELISQAGGLSRKTCQRKDKNAVYWGSEKSSPADSEKRRCSVC